MKRTLSGSVILLIVCGAIASPGQSVIGEGEVSALIQAITDEIYTKGYYKAYTDIETDRIPLYIRPDFDRGRMWVIYKLLPHGEVFRGAYLAQDNRLVILESDPDSGFPPTQGGAMKTVYMDDEIVIGMKTAWMRRHFAISISPTAQALRDAKHRQELRVRAKLKQ